MTYTPYFRHETNNINFGTGIYAPSFPVNAGLSLYSFPSQKMSYTTTTRYFGSSEFTLNIKGVKRGDLDTIKEFWENSTRLDEGYNDFTIIDNKARMLFEASWNNWHKRWDKRRGGVYELFIDIDSSVPWTPPVLGAYLMTTDTDLNNHTLQGDNLTADDGTLVDIAADTSILRNNGYALKVTGDGTNRKTGASASIDWKSNVNGSLSLFCQFLTFNSSNQHAPT